MLKTTDNNCGNCQVSQQDLENFQKISNTKIKDITIGNNSNLLVYPQSFSSCEDYIYDGKTNNFYHKNDTIPEKEMVKSWFN